jgi:hypothetical protein
MSSADSEISTFYPLFQASFESLVQRLFDDASNVLNSSSLAFSVAIWDFGGFQLLFPERAEIGIRVDFSKATSSGVK